MIKKFIALVRAHAALSLIAAVILVVGGYVIIKNRGGTTQTRYVLATVQRGAIITSVSGSGQISTENQVDVKAKASGDSINIPTYAGQEVKTGAVLAYLDARDAQKTVRDAETNLASANVSLQKLKQPADELATLQAENAITSAAQTKQKAADDLQKAYDDGLNAISNAFIDLPEVMTGLHDLLLTSSIIPSQTNMDYYGGQALLYDDIKAVQYKNSADKTYQAARVAFDANFAKYKSANRGAEANDIIPLLDETYDTAKYAVDALKSANNLIRLYRDKLTERNQTPIALSNTHLATLNGYTATVNGHLSSLLSIKNTIKNTTQTIADSERTIAEKTASFNKLKSGADALDIAAQELSVTQKKNALMDAQQKLADYTIRAPFDGIIAKVSIKKGDSVSANSAIATIITKQRTAVISLNEVDAAKIQLNQKATLSFDAIEGLQLTGEVSEIDTIGTVNQGVVTYNVKILFDTQSDRIKPGMSVTASIITEVKQDVLMAPNSAIKTQGNAHYIEVFDPPIRETGGSQGVASATPPHQQQVETGISNDASTEMISGVKEGDQIVVRTIAPSTAAAAPQAPSIFGSTGGNRGGGAIRIPR